MNNGQGEPLGAVILVGGPTVTGSATNPAIGQSQVILVSESEVRDAATPAGRNWGSLE